MLINLSIIISSHSHKLAITYRVYSAQILPSYIIPDISDHMIHWPHS